MADTTPTPAPQSGDQPEAAASTTPPVTPAPPASPPVAPAEPRSRRGLLLAGGIVAALIVLAGTFGGGVLVGSYVHQSGTSARVHQGPFGEFPGRQGMNNDGRTAPNGGAGPNHGNYGGQRMSPNT